MNPAMEAALQMLQKFASDVHEGKVPENRLSFGAPWRHPPRDDNPDLSYKWAKIQLMDFVQSFVNTEFGVIIPSFYNLALRVFGECSLDNIREIGKHSLFPYFTSMPSKYFLHILHHLFMERQGFIIFYFVHFTGELPCR